jgi:hypothetical protein
MLGCRPTMAWAKCRRTMCMVLPYRLLIGAVQSFDSAMLAREPEADVIREFSLAGPSGYHFVTTPVTQELSIVYKLIAPGAVS